MNLSLKTELSKRIIMPLSLVVLASAANAANILITQFDFSGYTDMKSALEADGHTVNIVDVRTAGTLATTLGSTSYDQVFLFDLTNSAYLNAADNTALASFWGGNRGLVVDGRSYGYVFQGTDPSEVALLQNVAAAFELTGGGVWVGTDHNPDWTRNANPFLSEIGVNPVTGSFSIPVNFADPASVLLAGVTPTDLWGGGASVGSTPIGIQPNGVEMFLHFGNVSSAGVITPYISASFPLQGPPPPNGRVPDGGATLVLLTGGLFGLGFFRRHLATP